MVDPSSAISNIVQAFLAVVHLEMRLNSWELTSHKIGLRALKFALLDLSSSLVQVTSGLEALTLTTSVVGGSLPVRIQRQGFSSMNLIKVVILVCHPTHLYNKSTTGSPIITFRVNLLNLPFRFAFDHNWTNLLTIIKWKMDTKVWVCGSKTVYVYWTLPKE